MAEELYKTDVEDPHSGLHNDTDPLNQPKGSYRYAMNGVNEVTDGKQGKITNEGGNFPCTQIPDGFVIIGDKYIGEDTSAIILVNPTTAVEHIGLLNKNSVYTPVVVTKILGLSQHKQCDITFRVRRGNEKVIYWVDALNLARTFNFNREYNFYTDAYQNYIKAGGDPNTYAGEKWDRASFDLIKSYRSIPHFSNVEILESGSCLPGSYNFAIQYVDEDLNPTEWITTSNIVRIYNDTTNNPFPKIRGSRNVDTSSQSFPRASKSIKLTITNLDVSFPYYRVAIIRAASNIGTPDKVFASELNPTSDSNFIYAGNDGALAEVALGDILVDQEIIFAPHHIEQLENRLLLANTRGKSINWCDFQQFASKISSKLATKQVILNNVLSEPNIKNAKSTFMFRGYMPGEAYSFAACYIFNDGYISPAFHIPGPNDPASGFKLYEGIGKYQDIHNCSTNNYWGRDYKGATLIGRNVRFHRFPFRSEVNKPLFTTSSSQVDIQKYRLRMLVSLNPAWTSTPPGTANSYPVDGAGDPLVISYTINFKPTGSASTVQLNGQLIDSDMGSLIPLYNDVTPLDDMSVGVKGQLDPASQLATYQVVGNERFTISFQYEQYTASSSINNDLGEIFGIEFGNIESPHPDVVGIYIVRNERTDDDRLIIDNAIVGTMTEFEQYKSFGLINPKNFYPVQNCGSSDSASGKSVKYFKKSMWFFNPEFQYLNRKFEFDELKVEGQYTETSVNMPTLSNKEGSICNDCGTKSVYIEDVQAGTSYNPEVHKKKNKDDDGFDLDIGYRNTNMSYAINTSALPAKKRILHLNAASYQNYESNTYYNVSVDNKIGMFITEDDVDTSLFYQDGDKKNRLLYASMTRNIGTAYSNFFNRSYYKEYNNPIMFDVNGEVNSVQIFNGDAEISAFNFVSTVFYDMVVADRPKKSKLWKIIVGAVLVVAAIVVSIVTVGAGAPAAIAVTASALSALAISYGVSLAVAGIKFEQFKSMIDTDYEKGLKDTVVDGGVWETVRDNIGRCDDTIRWFSDRVSNLYIESNVPFGLRCGLTCGVPDFIDAPNQYNEEEFRSYLIEKLTAIDRDQGSGRIYKGYATAELYDINLDYMRFNKEKIFVHLQLEYDCCADKNELFPTRVWYSQQSFQEESTDNYRVFLPNNYRDIEGEHGEITDLYRFGNSLFIHTEEGLWHLPQNVQERVTNEIVSFIGTGEFFSIPPRKVIDDALGSGGTIHKWATIKTRSGVLFVSEIEGRVYLHTDGVKEISSTGLRDWFEENLTSFLPKQLYDKFGILFPYYNNPASRDGVGYISNFDTRYNRILLTKKDYLLRLDKLNQLILVSDKPVAGTAFVYAVSDGHFYQGTTQIHLDNTDYFEDRSWTISYSFHTNTWVSYHSYLPNYYIRSQNNFYSFKIGSSSIWKHNMVGKYQTFYGKYYPFLMEIVKVNNPIQDKIIEDFTFQTEARKWVALNRQFGNMLNITFTKMWVYSDAQSSGYLILKVKETEANQQDWYQNQLTTLPGQILITNKESNWNLNSLRDFVVNYGNPLSTSEWQIIKGEYPIDKLPNPGTTDFNKPWYDLNSFRGKYIVVRLKFDTFDDINLTFNYLLTTEQPSIR